MDRDPWRDWLEMSAPASPSASQARPVTIRVDALYSISATHTSRSSEEMASVEDQIAALRSQLKEQRLWNARFEEKSAGLAKRVGRLELAGKAGAAEDDIVMLPPDARKATVDGPEAVAETNPAAAVGAADTAELEQTYELAESMCNVSLFLGRRDVGMGPVVTFWAVLVLLLNILLQTTIAVIVLLNLGEPTFFASMIEDLWYASGPHFASAQHVICCGVACNLP